MLQQPAVFVDLETTGTNPVSDRITEIAIIETRGNEVINEWSTLVNPEKPVPSFIQRLTGISDDMLREQPPFADIAGDLLAALDGRLLVAHNARFDYGFLRNEFQRAGISYQSPVLCTVKLSRKLHPEHKRHNLDSIASRYDLKFTHRHRALGDTQVMLAFVQKMYAIHSIDTVEAAVSQTIRQHSLPPGLDAAAVGNLPDTPGVYLFYDERDTLLYVGKSIHLRSRILSHFSGDHRCRTDARISQQVRRVEVIETAGELGALLREAQLIKQRQPVHNKRLRRKRDLCALQWDADCNSAVSPRIVSTDSILPSELSSMFGVFRTRRQASKTLRSVAEAHELCHKRLGLEQGKGPCFAYQLKKCRGVCAGVEPEMQHYLRMLTALSALRLQAWPFEGAIGLREQCATSDRNELHVIDHWCYLGAVDSEAGLHELLAGETTPVFELDTYRILLRYLRKHPDVDIISASTLKQQASEPRFERSELS